MIQRIAHILNGDELLRRFPAGIPGERIVFRECLIDGPLSVEPDAAFFLDREAFIHRSFHGTDVPDYNTFARPELEKILALDPETVIYCWFEDDLFCQTNFWWVLFVLISKKSCKNIRLVRPGPPNPYSFALADENRLVDLFDSATPLLHLETLASLWPLYATGNSTSLLKTAGELKDEYPFIFAAARAWVESLSENGEPGRPEKILESLLKELGNHDFATIFREFSKREPVYGYSDLQVKSMLERILSHTRNHNTISF